MKNLFILSLVAILNLFTLDIDAQTSNSAYDSIKLLNLDYYAAKPVDSLLHVIPQSYDYIGIIGTTRNNARSLCIYYPNNLNILITPKKYKFMTRNDPNRIWNLTLFKKETAYLIEVIHPDPLYPSLLGQQ
jgi:hypothetical protein